MDHLYPYPADCRRPTKKQKRNLQNYPALSSMPSLFANTRPSSKQFLNVPQLPSHKASKRPIPRVHDDLDEFLSSDLELSFASNMSLNSPPRDSHSCAADSPVPMDISPAPAPSSRTHSRDISSGKPTVGRARAYTSSARLFGRDMSNDNDATPTTASVNPSDICGTGTSHGKKLQRAALPFEWMAPAHSLQFVDSNENIFVHDATDAMDVDTSFSQEVTVPQRDFSSPVAASAAPTITNFNALFYDSQSPERPSASPSAPQLGKRRSVTPDSVSRNHRDVSSSPAPPSSPSVQKFERIASGPLPGPKANKPMLEGLGLGPSKRLRRPIALTSTMGIIAASQLNSAHPILSSQDNQDSPDLLPPRRAFSAMLPPTALNIPASPSDEGSSFDLPDMSSPAQAYTKRQQTKTLRRCDGSDNLRPMPMHRGTPSKENSPRQLFNENSPSARWLMPGFGDNEAHGKILPCHRVKEDGLMRVSSKTVDNLLDGIHDDKLAAYHIIDCRFDYEYNGGHIPGALNINTTSALEEYLLGKNALKPKPSTSGDANSKTVLIFHCEFSAKRAPTFAKHLRSKDRATNNHVYPKVHYPEIYILEGGYCAYFKGSSQRCEPVGYVRMDDPNHATSRREDLDQFRRAKFGRTRSYAYGDGAAGAVKMSLPSQQQQKRNTAPSTGASSHPLFAAANAARTRRGGGGLTTLPEDGSSAGHSDDEDTDIGDSPCPPPSKGVGLAFKGSKIGRAPLARAETYGPIRMNY